MTDWAILAALPAQRRLIALDLRDTGQSAILENAASYRCDRLVDDIVASDVDPTQRGS